MGGRWIWWFTIRFMMDWCIWMLFYELTSLRMVEICWTFIHVNPENSWYFNQPWPVLWLHWYLNFEPSVMLMKPPLDLFGIEALNGFYHQIRLVKIYVRHLLLHDHQRVCMMISSSKTWLKKANLFALTNIDHLKLRIRIPSRDTPRNPSAPKKRWHRPKFLPLFRSTFI